MHCIVPIKLQHSAVVPLSLSVYFSCLRPSSTQSTIHTNSLVLHCRDCLLCVSLVSLLSCFSLCIVHEYEVTLLKFLAQTSRCADSHACFRQVKYHNVCVSACRLSLYALSTPCHVFLIVLTFLRIRIRAWRLSSTAHHEIDKARTHAHALPATRATYWIFKTFPFNFPLMDFVGNPLVIPLRYLNHD